MTGPPLFLPVAMFGKVTTAPAKSEDLSRKWRRDVSGIRRA